MNNLNQTAVAMSMFFAFVFHLGYIEISQTIYIFVVIVLFFPGLFIVWLLFFFQIITLGM